MVIFNIAPTRNQDNASGGKWFVLEEGPGVADFHIWEMLDQHRVLAERLGSPNCLDKFPRCKAFHQGLEGSPQPSAVLCF